MTLRTIMQRSIFIQFVAIGGLLAPAVCLGQTYNLFAQPLNPSPHAWVYCRSINTGQIVYNCPVRIETQYYSGTNAHFHGDLGRPQSIIHCVNSFQCSSNDAYGMGANTLYLGSIEVYTLGSLVGQAERLKATTDLSFTWLDYVVGYNDVYYNDHPEIWLRIGGSETGGDTGHGSTDYNRYMMSYAAYGLYYATQNYLVNHPGQGLVCTNDMALPFGGKFDISSTSRWHSPHIAHDRGTAADVAGPTSAQCPDAYEVNITEFIDRCVDQGALRNFSINESNHAHCNWADPATYPH